MDGVDVFDLSLFRLAPESSDTSLLYRQKTCTGSVDLAPQPSTLEPLRDSTDQQSITVYNALRPRGLLACNSRRARCASRVCEGVHRRVR